MKSETSEFLSEISELSLKSVENERKNWQINEFENEFNYKVTNVDYKIKYR